MCGLWLTKAASHGAWLREGFHQSVESVCTEPADAPLPAARPPGVRGQSGLQWRVATGRVLGRLCPPHL